MVFVLVLAAISLAMTLAMLIMVSRGSYVSGQQKTIPNGRRSGPGRDGGDVPADLEPWKYRRPVHVAEPDGRPDQTVRAHRYLGGGLDNASTINPAVATSYDMTIDLGAYRVYTKIVDTVDGNSGADEGLLKTAVVNAGSGEVTVVSVPYLYTIEVLSQSTTNATERSKLSVLYQY